MALECVCSDADIGIHLCVTCKLTKCMCVVFKERQVLPELQATFAGGCSLITAINLATDRGQERHGAGA